MSVLIQCQIENVSTRKDRTLKLVLGTQELLKDAFSELFSYQNNICNVYISTNKITNEAINEIDKASVDMLDTIKSPSQRLRGVLYLNFQKEPKGFKTFENYYISQMETLLNHFKEKLD